MVRRILDRAVDGLDKVRKTNRNQWVTVGVSFMLSVTLWFLVTLNTQSYVARIQYPLKVYNVPVDVQIDPPPPSVMNLIVEGSGINLLSEMLNFSRDSLRIDFRKYSSQGYFVPRSNLSTLNEVLPLGIKAQNARPDSVMLKYQTRISKRVPVISALNLEFQQPYRLPEDITFTPDSVKVLAPEDVLATIQSWKTQALDLSLNGEAQTLQIPLDTARQVVVSPSEVVINLRPLPYTEARMLVSLGARNLPPNTSLQMTPPKVEIRYLVPFGQVDQLSDKDFFVTVDFGRISSRSKYLVPQVVRKPENVEVIGIKPERVEYLIIQEK